MSLGSWQLKKTLRDNPDSEGFTEKKPKNIVSNKGKIGIQTKEAFTSNVLSSLSLAAIGIHRLVCGKSY